MVAKGQNVSFFIISIECFSINQSINGNKIGDIYSHSFGQSQGNDPLPDDHD